MCMPEWLHLTASTTILNLNMRQEDFNFCNHCHRVIVGLDVERVSKPSVHAQMYLHKLQALVYDILPSTTAVFSYAIGSRKLSANEQFFVGAQTVVSLLQTT